MKRSAFTCGSARAMRAPVCDAGRDRPRVANRRPHRPPAGLVVPAVNLDAILLAELNREVAVHRLVVQEILANLVTLVTKTQDEVGEAADGVALHDVPEHGTAADLDHRLGKKLGLFAEARAHASTENHHGRHAGRQSMWSLVRLGL